MIGEAACLGAALCWACAVVWFRGPIAEHGSWAVNLAKIVLASGLLGVTTLVVGQAPALWTTPGRHLALVAVSGLLGLSLGDTALFAAVGRLGPHRTLLFQTLGPVFAAMLAFTFYGERLGTGQLVGAGLVLAGVVTVVWTPRRLASVASAPWDVAGMGLAVLAAFGQGSGVVVAKAGLEQMPVIAAAFLRLTTAALGLWLVMAAAGRLGKALRLVRERPALRRIVGPTILGTYVAFLLMMAGIAFAPASIAAVLLATSPVFSLFVEARVLGTPITWRGVLGTLVAVVGVALLSIP